MKRLPCISRRTALAWGGSAALSAPKAQALASSRCSHNTWPLWEGFREQFIAADGRVIDHSTAQSHSTSEGQAYAMFFALVANDRASFDRIWIWSVSNLAQGDMGARLPAWQWGRKTDGSWGVIDANSASDADTWMAYTLLEAGRAWVDPKLVMAGKKLLERIVQDEVLDLPGLGKMLMPGAKGFVKSDTLWRLNPSYLPLMLLRRFAAEQPEGPWADITANTVRMINAITPKGVVPDWTAFSNTDSPARFVPDPDSLPQGSYDAIRVYLWAGMLSKRDSFHGSMQRRLAGMVNASVLGDGVPPEFVQQTTGVPTGVGSVGFSAALIPFFKVGGHELLYRLQIKRVRTLLVEARGATSPPYYDQVLALFGLGWDESRYAFSPNGQLQLKWESTCPSTIAQ